MTPVEHVHCSKCGKRCSGIDPELGLVVRAWVECPECLEKSEGNSAKSEGNSSTLARALAFVAEFKGDGRCALNCLHSEALAAEVYRLRAALASRHGEEAPDDPARLQDLTASRSESLVQTQPSSSSPSPDNVMDMYVPGAWTCPKCNFALSKQTVFMDSGEVGCSRDDVMKMDGEFCPNDGEPMRRETWRERAEHNREWGASLMEEIITATRAEHLPGALAAIKERFGKA